MKPVKASRFRVYKAYSFSAEEQDPVIGEIRAEMARLELNATKLASESDVSKSAISKWVNGKTRRPTFSAVAAVGSALGFSGFDWRSRKLIKRRV